MSLNHLLTSNSDPLSVEFNNVKINGVLEVDGVVFAAPTSGTYTSTVLASNGVTATIEPVGYIKVGKICKVTALVSCDFAGVIGPGTETFTVIFQAVPGTTVSGGICYGTATGGASTQFGSGISPPLVGIYASTPSLSTVSMELRHSDGQKTSSTHLDSTVTVEITYEDTSV